MAKREWWLVEQSNGTYTRFETNPHWVTADVKVRVVEHSELERAETLIAKLEQELDSFFYNLERDRNCDCCNNNQACTDELKSETLQLIKEWREK